MNRRIMLVAAAFSAALAGAANADQLAGNSANPYEVQTPSSPNESGPVRASGAVAVDNEHAHGATHQSLVRERTGSFHSQSVFPSSPNESAPSR